MRALVLERRGSYAIVLMPGGRFARVRAPYAAVGEEIETGRHARLPAAGLRPYGYAAAALAVVLAVLPAALPHANAQVAAYATLDLNPSVEFGLSSSGVVVTSKGLDRDGRRVLAQVQPNGQPFSSVVSDVLRKAADDGLIAHGSDASLILATYPAGPHEQVPAAVKQQMLVARAKGKAFLAARGALGIVSAMVLPTSLRLKASQADVSAGTYALYAALKGAGIPVTVKEFKGRGLGKAIERIAGTPKGKAVLPLLTGAAQPATSPTPPSGSSFLPTTPSGATPTQPSTTPSDGPLTPSNAAGQPSIIILSPDGSSSVLGPDESGAGQSAPTKGRDRPSGAGGGAKGQGQGGAEQGGGLKGHGSKPGQGSGDQGTGGKGSDSGRGQGQGHGQGQGDRGNGRSGGGQTTAPGSDGTNVPSGVYGPGSQDGTQGWLLPQSVFGSWFQGDQGQPGGGSGD